MRVLGVDPGTIKMGVGLVACNGGALSCEYFDVIKAKPKTSLPERLGKIYDSLLEIIYEKKPDIVAVENVFFAKDFRASVKIGEARAVAMLAADRAGVSVAEYLPTRVKQAVCGNGHASKVQIQAMIKDIFKLKGKPTSDEADALAIAVCHHNTAKLEKLKKNAKVF